MPQLSKGGNAPLTATNVVVTVDVNAPADLSALLVTESGKVRSDNDFVFYNQPTGPGVRCVPPAGGQGWKVEIDTAAVPADIAAVRVVSSLESGRFGAHQPPVAHVRETSGAELIDFPVTGLNTESIVVVLELYRRQGAWKVRAVGQGYAGGLADLIRDHGVSVDDAPAATPPPGPAPTPSQASAPPAAPSAPAAPPAPPSAPGYGAPAAPAYGAPPQGAPAPGGQPGQPPSYSPPPAAPSFGQPGGQPPQQAPSYGQPPQQAPTYGQPQQPPAYGQQPPAYGGPPQQAPSYGQQPPYGQPPAGVSQSAPVQPQQSGQGEVSLSKSRPVSLTKGQRVTLTKDGGEKLTVIRMGLGWDPLKKGGLFGRREVDIDLDASAVLLAGQEPVDLAFYNHLRTNDGSVQHMGDNRTGEGDGDDEVIMVDLTRIPVHIDTIYFIVTSYEGQTFEQVANAFVRLVDHTTGAELARYALAGGMPFTGLVMAKVYRQGSDWKLQAIGDGIHAKVPQEALPHLVQSNRKQ